MSKYAKKFKVKTEDGSNTIVSKPISVDTTDLQSEETLSIEQILEIGADVFNFAKDEIARLEPKDENAKKSILKSVQDRFPKFRRDYPIVIRWAVFEGEYFPSALEHYIKNCFQVRYKHKSDFAEAQAEYVVAIHKLKNKKLGGKELQRLRSSIVRVMLKEEKDFDKAVEEAKEECERLEKAENLSKRNRLLKFIQLKQQNGELLPATGSDESDQHSGEVLESESRESTFSVE